MRLLLVRKLARDVAARKGQFAFMALAVFIAAFALSTMLGVYAVLRREVRANYLSTAPAQATLVLDRIDSSLRTALASGLDPEILAWEARGSALGRIRNPKGGWSPLLVFIVDDFATMKVGKAFHEDGAWPPAPGSLLVERSAMQLIDARIGDARTIVFPAARSLDVAISGTAHDPGLAPAWQERTVDAYCDAATYAGLIGAPASLDQLKVIFRDSSSPGGARPSRDDIRRNAEALGSRLKKSGYSVVEIQIPSPEAHPHQSQMDTILIIFLIFSFLALLLSSILLGSVLKTLMSGEVRLIGVMKSVGGGTLPLARHYLLMALAPALAGSVLALPLGALASEGLSNLLGGLLNLDLSSAASPMWVFLATLGAGLILPLLLAAVPVTTGIRMSVRDALSPQDIGQPSRGRSHLRLPPLLAMAVRNLGRRPARLALSLSLLGIAGALFMTAMNIQAGWSRTLSRSLSLRRFDLELRLVKPVDAEIALATLRGIPGVRDVESRALLPAYAASSSPFPLSSVYPDKGHGSFSLRGLPKGAALIELPLLEGNDLSTSPSIEGLPLILLNQNARALFDGAVVVGRPIELSVDGARRRFGLAGVVRVFAPAAAYLDEKDMSPFMRGSNAFLIAFEPGQKSSAGLPARACEDALRGIGGVISLGLPEEEFSTAVGEHTQILIFALLIMAILMGIVGLLGLSASLGATVLERTRETGVLRSIGAGRLSIFALIVSETELTALLSLGIAGILSFPSSYVLGKILGQLSFRLPLDFVVSGAGIAIWIIACLVGAGLSCAGAVRSTLRLPLPRALAWE